MGRSSFSGNLESPPPRGPNLPVEFDLLHSDKTFLQAAGGEVIKVGFAGGLSRARMIAHQARTLYFSGHGFYDPGALILNGDHTTEDLNMLPLFYATDAKWDKNLETVIVAGCSIFGVRNDKYRIVGMGRYDYKSFTKKQRERWPNDPSPGEKWEPLSPKYKLGYCWTAPQDTADGSNVTAGIVKVFYELLAGGINPIQA